MTRADTANRGLLVVLHACSGSWVPAHSLVEDCLCLVAGTGCPQAYLLLPADLCITETGQ